MVIQGQQFARYIIFGYALLCSSADWSEESCTRLRHVSFGITATLSGLFFKTASFASTTAESKCCALLMPTYCTAI